MAASCYDEALRRLLAHEGGYSNHPSDPGGPTRFGITLADARKYGGEFGWNPDPGAADMRALPVWFAKAVYRAKYWNALRCDDLPAGVDYAVFDYGVNSGVARAGKVLRRALAVTDDTWTVSDAVLAAARNAAASKMIRAICNERRAFLQRLKTWPVFGAGWSRRVADVEAAALAMSRPGGARGATPTPAAPVEKHEPGKGVVPESKAAQRTTTGAVVVTGAGAAQAAGEAGCSPLTIIAIVAFAVALAAGCWLGFRWWRRRRQERPLITGDTT
jgi:lysozyme family protein